MTDSSSGGGASPGGADGSVQYYKRDFWSRENLKYAKPHYRLEKASRIINRIARGRECTLFDVGCGPAALRPLLAPNIRYFGADIAIQEPAPYLLEADFIEGPIQFGGRKFDIVLAQGFFEYVGEHQSQKFAEIAALIKRGGIFITTYVNFGHRDRQVYWPYSNVQPFADFRANLSARFDVRRFFPTSHNWRHGEPNRRGIRDVNMHLNLNVPFLSPWLAVEYFVISRPR
ncbi:MAG TPA: class I SAM-dependent methyltransferase [Streptosporangiaceae bacterium]|jgi:SAM-dependent methyltransferase|nr:class I SAM-dependent methyltransferase [Streptosporangiaceae bacterium]